MRGTPISLLALASVLGGLLFVPAAWPHGGVVEEDDVCIINIGVLKAHFKIYLPRDRGQVQFCEDLPLAGESVFVMEYLHPALNTVPVDFRVIRNTTGLGRFAEFRDIEGLGDLDPLTVFHPPPQRSPGVYTTLHRFETPGDYIGIVRTTLPGSDTVHTAVFPFKVGGHRWSWLPLPVLALLGLQWAWRRLGRHGKRRLATVALVVSMGAGAAPAQAGTATGQAGRIELEYASDPNPPVINRMHDWTLRLRDRDGQPLDECDVAVSGGMPAHDHGLPTQPRVRPAAGEDSGDMTEGGYRLEGLRFHMPGAWVLQFDIDCGAVHDTVAVALEL